MRVLIALAILLALAVAGVVAIGTFVSPDTRAATPAGMPRNEAVYVTMRDGVRIAVDLWYPSGLAGSDDTTWSNPAVRSRVPVKV